MVAPAASFVYHQVIQLAAHFVNTYVVQPLVHVAVAKAVKTAAHAVVHAAKAVGHVVASAATAVGRAVGYAAAFVKDHASTIAGIAADVVVGAACTAATLGIGAVGCAAIGGAVGGAVSYGMDCSKAHNWSVGGAAAGGDSGVGRRGQWRCDGAGRLRAELRSGLFGGWALSAAARVFWRGGVRGAGWFAG